MHIIVLCFFSAALLPRISFASSSSYSALLYQTATSEKLPKCKTEKSICSTLITSKNTVTEVKRHCLCPRKEECSMNPDNDSIQITEHLWYGTCRPLQGIPECKTGQRVVRTFIAEDQVALEAQCLCVEDINGKKRKLWDDEKSFMSRPFCTGLDAFISVDGKSVGNAPDTKSKTILVRTSTLTNHTQILDPTIPEINSTKDMFYKRRSGKYNSQSNSVKRNPRHFHAFSKKNLNGHHLAKSSLDCRKGSNSSYCNSRHENTFLRHTQTLSSTSFQNNVNNNLKQSSSFHGNASGKMSKDNQVADAFSALVPKDNREFYKQDHSSMFGLHSQVHDSDNSLYKRNDYLKSFYKKSANQNDAFYKRSRDKRRAFYKRQDMASSMLYKQGSKSKRRNDDNIAFYKRWNDGNSAFYKRGRSDKIRSFYKRLHNADTAFYKRSSHDTSAFYKRSPDKENAFYKRWPFERSAFYKRALDDKSAYVGALDGKSAFYKRGPTNKNAFYKRRSDENNGYYKRQEDKYTAFYKRHPN